MTLNQESKLKEALEINEQANKMLNEVLLSLKPLQGYFSEKANESEQEKLFQIENKSKNKKQKCRKSVKPKQKGDADMKNITFRTSDFRYIGRKQINGKIITVYAKTQKACFEKLKQAINEYECNTKKTKSSSVKFIDYFEKWYANNKEPYISEGTQKDILLVKKVLEPFHDMLIKKITKDMIIDFLKKLPHNRTKEKTILYFKACLKSAILDNVIKQNPFNNLITDPVMQKTKPAFNYEQQVKLLQELEFSSLRPIILIYLITGLRKNELNFKSIEKDIDYENNILKARNEKGRNKVIRYKYIKLSEEARKLILSNLDIIHSYNSEKVYKEFNKFLKKIDIKGSIVTCRHTFATNCFYLGKPELIISREMGHKSTNITKEVYTDIDYKLNKEKVLKLYNNLYNLE